jgi:hypothetical protein
MWYPWGRAPQQQGGGGSVPSGGGGGGGASAFSGQKKREAAGEPKKARKEKRQEEERVGEGEVLELGRLRLHIGAPLPRGLQRRFTAWLIAKRECSRADEAAAQVAVLQRLFRQALAVREYKLWRAGLRGVEAEPEAEAKGRPLDLHLEPGSLADKAAVRQVVTEAVSFRERGGWVGG